MTTTMLLVDDQEMIRAGLRLILTAQDDFIVLDDAADGFAALTFLTATPVDVVLMDVRMPGIDGVETTRRIREHLSAERTRIIVLTTFEHDDTVVAALRAGANGFLSKTAGPDELVDGIREVLAGGGALSAAAQAAAIQHVATTATAPTEPGLADRFATLTPRERDVVIAIARGGDNDEIGQALFVSPFTVKTHANRAMAKVGARDRAQLVSLAYRAGLIA